MRRAISRWWKPWLLSGATGMVVFGLVHQVLVVPAPFVFVGVPMAVALSTPIVASYAALGRAGAPPTGVEFGFIVFAGFVPNYALITVAMWGRTFDDGPRGGWQFLAVVSAPIVSGLLCWLRFRSVLGTVLLVLGTGVLTFFVTGFQQSEPDWRNVGAFVSMLPACLAAGWMLGRVAPDAPRIQRSRIGAIS